MRHDKGLAMLTNTKSPATHAIYRMHLKELISVSQKQIRENINTTGSNIIHRTQAINAKRSYHTIEEEKAVREDILGEQIKIWKRVLPTLLQKVSSIKFQF